MRRLLLAAGIVLGAACVRADSDMRLPQPAAESPVAQTRLLSRSKGNLPQSRLATDELKRMRLSGETGFTWMVAGARRTPEGRMAGPWNAAPLGTSAGPYGVTLSEREDARLLKLTLTNDKKQAVWEADYELGPKGRLELITVAPDGSYLLTFESRVFGDRAGYKVTWNSLKRPSDSRFLSNTLLQRAVPSPDSQYILIDGLRLVHVPTWTSYELENAVLRKPFYLVSEDFMGWSAAGKSAVFRVIYSNEDDPRWEEKWRVDLK